MENTIQIIINSIISGLVLSLVSIGFTYIFLVTRVFHLANAGIYAVASLSCWWILSISESWLISISFSIIITSILIVIIEKAIYYPLNKNKSNHSVSLIASMGVHVVIVNILFLLFGSENKIFTNYTQNSYSFGNFIVSKIQIIQMITSVFAITIFYFFFKLSKRKLILQTITDNEEVSMAFGINIKKYRLYVLLIGSILVIISSILTTLEVGIDPLYGMDITLSAAVITIVVSNLNIKQIVFFSVLLVMIQNFVEWFLNPQWKIGITFILLLLLILYRTEGTVSYNLRKDKV